MADAKLVEALDNCLVNFDRRMHVTELVEEYELAYSDVDAALRVYLKQQEEKFGIKYEKRFLVHGEELDSSNEVYTVVQGETKLKEWRAKLKNAESSLYSVEVAGGAKAPAQLFKPMTRCALELKSLKVRPTTTKTKEPPKVAATTAPRPAVKTDAKPTTVPAASSTSAAASKVEKPKKPTPEGKKISPEVKKKTSPEEKKTAQKAAPKKGIGNFFAPAPAAAAKTASKKEEKPAAKPPTPKGVQDLFKKQAEKTPVKEAKTEAANASIQLFSDGDASESSDEEEKIAALQREIITSDHEKDDDEGDAAGSSKGKAKRRRIEDSDDEEAAPKHEKRDAEVVEVTDASEPPQSDSYLDDEGFVITIKSKKPHAAPAKPKAAPRSPPKAAPKSKPAPAPPAKTKQGNITSFFSKK